MRCLHISAMESGAIIQKMVEEELIGTDHRLISVKKEAWNAFSFRMEMHFTAGTKSDHR